MKVCAGGEGSSAQGTASLQLSFNPKSGVIECRFPVARLPAQHCAHTGLWAGLTPSRAPSMPSVQQQQA